MLNNLKLGRPIAFIDVETTGLTPHLDRIVELSILKIYPDATVEYKSHRIYPGIPIPAEATNIHGITNDDVASEPMFCQYAKSTRDFLDGCDIAGFNIIKFDLPFLEAEFDRAKVEFSRRSRYLIDTMAIYHQREPRDLEAAYKKYCGKQMDNAHSAEGDATAAAEVLDGQLAMYQDLPRDISELCALCYDGHNYIDAEGKFIWVEDEAVCNFGKKHKGKRLKDIVIEDPEYLDWIASADFSTEVKDMALRALDGER